MEKRKGTTSIALLVEPIRSRGRAMLVVAIWIFIDQTQTHLHRPYKEKEAAMGFVPSYKSYVMRGHVRLDTMNDENPRLFS